MEEPSDTNGIGLLREKCKHRNVHGGSNVVVVDVEVGVEEDFTTLL